MHAVSVCFWRFIDIFRLSQTVDRFFTIFTLQDRPGSSIDRQTAGETKLNVTYRLIDHHFVGSLIHFVSVSTCCEVTDAFRLIYNGGQSNAAVAAR